ncbi:MAG: hypothetical protein ACO28P_10605, partial [Ilumatobacteraceae bacterium]
MAAPRKRYKFPATIGDYVADWIEDECRHGPGDVYGEPVVLTPEERAFLLDAYAIDRMTGRRLIDVGVYERPKGSRKSELGVWVALAEMRGPTRAFLDGNEKTLGPPLDPYITVLATTEGQADATAFGALRVVIAASPTLAGAFDVGMDRILMRDRPGKIDLLASGKPAALDGARPTFSLAEELHLWVGPTLSDAWATNKRNLKKRMAAQPWLFSPTTAYRHGQHSVLESLHEQAGRHGTARKTVSRLLYDRRQASEDFDLSDPADLRAAVVEAGGDAFWRDIEGIVGEYSDPRVTESEYRRFWLGQIVAADDAFLDPADWRECEHDGLKLEPGETITLGFDGSLSDDHTALVACRVSDGAIFPLGHWVPPEGGQIDQADVDGAVRHAFDTYRVWSMFPDPPYWWDWVARWQSDFGVDRVKPFNTNSRAKMSPALDAFRTAVRSKALIHPGNPNLMWV